MALPARPQRGGIRRQFPAVALEIFGNFTLGLSHASFHDLSRKSRQTERPRRSSGVASAETKNSVSVMAISREPMNLIDAGEANATAGFRM